MKKHLITFATKEYYVSANLLRKSALTHGFDYVHVYTESDIKDFRNKYPELFAHKRGYGLWSWKPYVMLDLLNKIPDNDLVFYMDSAITIEEDLEPVFKMIENKQNLFFYIGEYTKNDYRIKTWTKHAVLDALNVSGIDNILNKPQILGGIQGHINNDKTKKIIKLWGDFCCKEELMSDTLDLNLDKNIKGHRHDQSILSIIVHLNKLAISVDISQFGNGDSPNHKKFLNLHRKCVRAPSLGIVTATTGSPLLEQNIISIQNQTYFNIKHYIIIDGKEYEEAAMKIINKYKNKMPIIVVPLVENTGRDNYYGHRIYGAMPYLMDTDYVSVLDEDDTVEPMYASTMVGKLHESQLDYAYCLRNIIDTNDTKICKDLCESLGHNNVNIENTILVGTSTHFMKRTFAIKIGHLWHNKGYQNPPVDPDRMITNYCRDNVVNYTYVPKFLVNYRVGSTSNSVKAQFFINGNKRYMFGNLQKNGIYLFHFNKDASETLFDNIDKLSERAYDDWQLTMVNTLKKSIKLQNGFQNKADIPPGSIVLFNICHPNDIEQNLDVFEREDIYKIAYTVESPNIRHQGQWDERYLFSRFDYVMTYWEPLLQKYPDKTIYCPFVHRLNFEDKFDDESLHANDNTSSKTIIMILEKRPFNSKYIINGVELQSQDYLREEYTNALDNITVYGQSWKNYHNQDKVTVLPSRFEKSESIVKYLKDYTFNLIIENTNAEGYVSEKFYDALVAGSIPIYVNRGNMNDKLGIPEDCYIDAGKMSPGELNTYINSMPIEEVRKYRAAILEKREDILKRNGPMAYDKAFKGLIVKIQLRK